MSADTDQSDLLGSDLPKQYELLGKIRTGGMGAIYKAQNRFTKHFYAIKVLHPEGANDPQTRQRFTIEAKAASSLKHLNICQVFDFGVTDSELLYLVMEWIDGISLDEKVSRDGPLPDSEVIHIFLQVCSALAFAHANNVVHRDLKPDNIMLSRDPKNGANVVHIVDFGIAKVIRPDGSSKPSVEGLTQSGTVVGTPSYMSPEQARAKVVDKRSDVYSLGCVMFFALSGRAPFLGDNYMDVLYQHVKEPPPIIDPKLKVSPKLIMIMLKTMEKAPDDRYRSMEDLAGDLRRLAKGVGIHLKPLAREREKFRKNALAIASFLLAFAVIYAVSIWLQNLGHPSASGADSQDATAKTEARTAKDSTTDKKPHSFSGKSHKKMH
jgi:serine/threonine protein kinase